MSETVTDNRVSYDDIDRSASSVKTLAEIDCFAPEVQAKFSMLARVHGAHHEDFLKVMDRLRDRWAKKDDEGNIIPGRQLIKQPDGFMIEVDVPGSFIPTDRQRWSDAIDRLKAHRVPVPAECMITEKDLRTFDPPDGYDGARPSGALRAGLGPFYEGNKMATVSRLDVDHFLNEIDPLVDISNGRNK